MKKFDKHIKNEPGLPKVASGFTVPDGYFDSFGERLNLRMKAEAESSHRKVAIKSILVYLKPALGLAAGLAILLMVYTYSFNNNTIAFLTKAQNSSIVTPKEDPSDLLPLPNVFAYLVTEGQFFSALTDMDEYDDAKMSKEVLVEYLASNCSDFEILNASK